ncbi:MAG: V-type ATP synthase subunit E [Synergistales bacterium]|nr:V-type ATP synthase subunit E [Synergistales bacterium]
MALADIKTKIQQEADEKAREIKEKANRKATKTKEFAEQEIEEREKENQRKINDEKPKVFQRHEIVADLDIKKARLGFQKTLIRDVFAKALDRLQNLSNEEYGSFAEQLLEEAMVSGDEEVVVGKAEKVLTREWLDAFNEKHGSSLKLAGEQGSFQGGFILRRGRIETNCTFEMLVATTQEDLESTVYEKLFSA